MDYFYLDVENFARSNHAGWLENIVELKPWYGEVAHEDASEQLTGYLNSKNKDVGYLAHP